MTILNPLVVSQADMMSVAQALGVGAASAHVYKLVMQYDFKTTTMLKKTKGGFLKDCRIKNWYQVRRETDAARKKAATLDTTGILVRTGIFSSVSLLTYMYLRRKASMLNLRPRFEA